MDGLLFGAIRSRTIKVISDMQEYTKEEHTAVLQHIHVSDTAWHDSAGVLDPAALEAIVASRAPMRLIGWFSSRLNSSPRPTLREIAVHSNLDQWRQAQSPAEQDRRLIFSLLTGSHSDAGDIMTQDFTAFVPEQRGAGIHGSLSALRTVFRNLGKSTQFEFGAFEPSCSNPSDLPRFSQETHPLDDYVSGSIAELEAQSLDCSELLQKVSEEQAELVALQQQVLHQRQLLQGLVPPSL